MACGAGSIGKGQTRTKVMAKTNATTTGRRCMGSLRAPSRSRRPPATCRCAEGSEAYRAAAYAPQSIVAATTECTHVSSMSWRGVSGCIRLSPRGRPLNRHPASGAAHRCQPLHGEVCIAAALLADAVRHKRCAVRYREGDHDRMALRAWVTPAIAVPPFGRSRPPMLLLGVPEVLARCADVTRASADVVCRVAG